MLIDTLHAGCGYSTLRSSASVQASGISRQVRRSFSRLSSLPSLSEKSSPLVYRSSSINPYHNLAIENFLLRNSAHTSHILFIYTNRPCVVIGRNQNPWLECNLKLIQQGLAPADNPATGETPENGPENRIPIDLVRRRSGGGTVFHDEGNLNYTVIVPNDTSFKRAKHAGMVARALKGIKSFEFGADIKVNDRNDIIMKRQGETEWVKISGSAFKLIRGRALHHGTLLYSSPYLDRISEILRSPGRDMIRAKGVESVRSKVGNLYWREDTKERSEVWDAVITAIVDEFRRLYGEGSGPHEVGDEDVYAEGNLKVAKGVEEMMTNRWRFEQTPKFDFKSGVLEEENEQDEITFSANRGVMERLSSRVGHGGEEVIENVQLGLHSIRDWGKTLQGIMGDDKALSTPWSNEALVKRIADTFPYWKNSSSENDT